MLNHCTLYHADVTGDKTSMYVHAFPCHADEHMRSWYMELALEKCQTMTWIISSPPIPRLSLLVLLRLRSYVLWKAADEPTGWWQWLGMGSTTHLLCAGQISVGHMTYRRGLRVATDNVQTVSIVVNFRVRCINCAITLALWLVYCKCISNLTHWHQSHILKWEITLRWYWKMEISLRIVRRCAPTKSTGSHS